MDSKSPTSPLLELREALESALAAQVQLKDMARVTGIGWAIMDAEHLIRSALLACPPEALEEIARLAEVGRRLEAMPEGRGFGVVHMIGEWRCDGAMTIGKGKTALEALRAANIGDEA